MLENATYMKVPLCLVKMAAISPILMAANIYGYSCMQTDETGELYVVQSEGAFYKTGEQQLEP